MPRRELLTPAQRASLLPFPEDEAELLQYYTLTTHDQAMIRQHRGATTNSAWRSSSVAFATPVGH